uniref:pancreatic elastase n=1 Tax=Lepisosteus oculatus TaxID=7918 RepID=W5MJT8_LEPOC
MLPYIAFIAFLVLSGRAVDAQNNTAQRVVGGVTATPNSWPWQVSIRISSSNCYPHNCGGVLVHSRWVLTTASCASSGTLVAFLGDHNIYGIEGREQIIPVERIIIHPSWTNNLAAGYDIALLKLSQNAVLNSYVAVASLPSSGVILPNNNFCYVTGWGSTSTYGQLSATLQQGYLPIVSYATCSSSAWWGSTVKTTMVCAGGDGYRAACYVCICSTDLSLSSSVFSFSNSAFLSTKTLLLPSRLQIFRKMSSLLHLENNYFAQEGKDFSIHFFV